MAGSFRRDLDTAISEENLDMITRLLESETFDSAELISKCSVGLTPLLKAVLLGYSEGVKTLAKFYTQFASRESGFPLHCACDNGETECVRHLVETLPPFINEPDDELRRYPIHYAVERGHIEIARILLQAGACPNTIASCSYHPEDASDIDYIHATTETPIMVAAENDHLDMIQLLLAHGAEPWNQDEPQNCPLSVAAYEGYPDILNALSTILPKESGRRDRAVTLAVYAANLSCIECLMQRGATPSYRFSVKRQQRLLYELILRQRYSARTLMRLLELLYNHGNSMRPIASLGRVNFYVLLTVDSPELTKFFLFQSGILDIRFCRNFEESYNVFLIDDFTQLFQWYEYELGKFFEVLSHFPVSISTKRYRNVDNNNEVAKYLYAWISGEPLHVGHNGNPSWPYTLIHDAFMQICDVPSLRHCCRLRIRALLAFKRFALDDAIANLPLPPALKRYLSYQHS